MFVGCILLLSSEKNTKHDLKMYFISFSTQVKRGFIYALSFKDYVLFSIEKDYITVFLLNCIKLISIVNRIIDYLFWYWNSEIFLKHVRHKSLSTRIDFCFQLTWESLAKEPASLPSIWNLRKSLKETHFPIVVCPVY